MKMKLRTPNILDRLCILLIFDDAVLNGFTKELLRLHDPCVETVHVFVSEGLGPFRRAKFLRHVRKIFTDAHIRVRTLTEIQLKYLAIYTERTK